MLKKIFGGKKSDYYLELKEDASPAKPEVSAEPSAQESPSAPAETPAVEEKPAEPVAKSAKSKKTSVKSKKAAAPKEKAPETASESVPLVTSFPVSAATSSQNGKAEPQEVAFASKYLLTPTLGRRLPGPSLNTFKSMARQVKKPRG
ncbi:hypothetical protein [Gloeothece verrucosa]|uniref:Uncharacterized protein n=1 Tax=Gloeothece verrucosa (strain PCC 7822) TaxID=497965 RepID=E0UEU8_GLOV7|nr:hypothetical protein [Gloeothece verrucosa]ADN13078.1 conserved hypothetical protein [Gloeothece verrucosa PCC 7822]